MVKCDKCGVETYMPYRCNYCGGYFCDEHRLPEFHDCKGKYDQAKPRVAAPVGEYTSSDNAYGNYSTSRVIRPYWFSKKELRDLAIGLVVIIAVPFFRIWNSNNNIYTIFGAVSILALAFILHELAHKFVAQHFGMWAEFRLSTLGLLFTFITFLLWRSAGLPLMIIAPGAVMIAGLMNKNEYGKISIAGPAVNIIQALVYLIILITATDFTIWNLSYYGILINAYLALFNLIPFGVFDGLKIFRWDKRVWLAAVVAAGALLLITMI